MHDSHSPAPSHADRHIPFTRGGWGFAAFVCLLALGSALTAFYVHRTTYKDPTDVRARAVGDRGAEGH